MTEAIEKLYSLLAGQSPLVSVGWALVLVSFTYGLTYATLIWHSRIGLNGGQPKPQRPPATAEWLITFLVPKKRHDGLLGDLEERFHLNVTNRGYRRARALYWAEALRSLGPLAVSWFTRLGLVALLAAVAKRYFG